MEVGTLHCKKILIFLEIETFWQWFLSKVSLLADSSIGVVKKKCLPFDHNSIKNVWMTS